MAHLDTCSVKGRRSLNGKTNTFFNIPYAQAPIGDLRFEKPVPVKLSGVLDGTKPGPSCMVNPKNYVNLLAKPSEDCLQLNVFTPSDAKPGDDLPVLVYVFGGAFTDGYATFPYGAGSRSILNQGHKVVIVTMNYRLGAFGFLPARELQERDNLNLGIHDVKLSFEWVRNNIRAFGGNPRQVTGYGYSAGSFIIGSLMTAQEGSLDLFDRAILQSGSMLPITDTIDRTQFVMDEFKRLSGCNSTGQAFIDCIKHMDAEQLRVASDQTYIQLDSPFATSYQPILDGTFITEQQSKSLESGRFRKIPVMITTNKDEGMYFTTTLGIDTPEKAKIWSQRLLPSLNVTEVQQLQQFYPKDNSGLAFHNASQILTDYIFACSARKMAVVFAQNGLPVYRGFFKHELDILKIGGALPLVPDIGVSHGSDLPMWWLIEAALPTPKERQLAKEMVQSLVDFASCADFEKCAVGGRNGMPAWPQYTALTQGARLEFEKPVQKSSIGFDNDADLKCEFYAHAVKKTLEQPPVQVTSQHWRQNHRIQQLIGQLMRLIPQD
ncbi:Carboxylesterase [Gorgonomyces haynaldii]|nr:Carboxylesterase [Gorgonomyces haynaldii]